MHTKVPAGNQTWPLIRKKRNKYNTCMWRPPTSLLQSLRKLQLSLFNKQKENCPTWPSNQLRILIVHIIKFWTWTNLENRLFIESKRRWNWIQWDARIKIYRARNTAKQIHQQQRSFHIMQSQHKKKLLNNSLGQSMPKLNEIMDAFGVFEVKRDVSLICPVNLMDYFIIFKRLLVCRWCRFVCVFVFNKLT